MNFRLSLNKLDTSSSMETERCKVRKVVGRCISQNTWFGFYESSSQKLKPESVFVETLNLIGNTIAVPGHVQVGGISDCLFSASVSRRCLAEWQLQREGRI